MKRITLVEEIGAKLFPIKRPILCLNKMLDCFQADPCMGEHHGEDGKGAQPVDVGAIPRVRGGSRRSMCLRKGLRRI